MTSDGARRAFQVVDKLPDGRLRVELFNEAGNTSYLSLTPQQLSTARFSSTSQKNFEALGFGANQSLKRPKNHGPPARTASEQVQRSKKKIDEVAPGIRVGEFEKVSPDKRGLYLSNGYWKQWFSGNIKALPKQGWKLHISSTPENAGNLAEALLPKLRELGIEHKVIDDMARYSGMEGTQKGKFITIYPGSPEEARTYVEIVNKIISKNGFSDKEFLPISKEDMVGKGVYARYGRLYEGNLVNKNGREIPNSEDLILSPNGQLYPDPRGLSRPEWVEPLK